MGASRPLEDSRLLPIVGIDGRHPMPHMQSSDARLDRAAVGSPDRRSDGLPGDREDAEQGDRPPSLQDGGRGALRRYPRLPRGDDRPPAAGRHPLDEAPLRHLHHGRVLHRPGPCAQRRAPDRPRRGHRPEQGQGAAGGGTSEPSPARRSRGRTVRSRPGAGWGGTAIPATAGGTTCTCPGCTRRPSRRTRLASSTRASARSRPTSLLLRPSAKPRTGGISPSARRRSSTGGISPPHLPRRLRAKLAPKVPEQH